MVRRRKGPQVSCRSLPSHRQIRIWSLVDSLLSLARDQEYGEATREGCTFKIRRPRGKCPKGQQLEDHHLLPFKFGYWFKQRECDIEDPTQHRCCPDSVHDEIHAAGWNKAWEYFIQRYPNASCGAIKRFASDLMNTPDFSNYYKQCTMLPGVGAGVY